MKILVLFGNGNKGKTETLNLLIDKLSRRDKKNIKELIKHGKDRCCILVYKGKIIKITTRGDNAKSLEEDFNFKKDDYCVDMFICAARGKGETHSYINSIENVDNIYWLSKRSISDCSCKGKVCSKDIVDYRKKQNQQQFKEILCLLNKIFEFLI